MRVRPDLDEFRRLAEPGRVVPVWREFLFDTETAVTAWHKLARGPFSFLLESVVGGERWARYSFFGTEPREAWRVHRGRTETWTPEEGWSRSSEADPRTDLDRRLRAWSPVEIAGLPRFWGGAVGYLSWDWVRRLERLPGGPEDDLDLPEALLVFTDRILVVDNLRGTARAVAAVRIPEDVGGKDVERLHREAGERTREWIERLGSAAGPPPLELREEPERDPAFTSSTTREEFVRGVERIREYVRAGDVFQVVLSQRLGMGSPASPFDLYRALRSLNPSPYLYLLELDGTALVGSSPEVLVRLEDGTVTVRPIAGTRPRGPDAESDRALAEELLADPKERAEHRMLVDLGRNDVGRVSRAGTVRVPELMEVERYSHVMHLVSRVEGEVREGLSALDVLEACFPAGTVSGAPKVRAMEIIDELEPVRRGPYAGAVGYLGYGGESMDTAIAIRTVVASGGRAWVQAGAGVVHDSDPEAEYEETLNKARALLRAGAMVGPTEDRGAPEPPSAQVEEPSSP